MNKFRILLKLFFLYSLLCSSLSFANSNMQIEINHLLNYVGTSDCIFIRNGSEHDADNALKHIQKKYKHFQSDINSTEEFIELSATKSMLSRKLYFIKCGDTAPVSSQEWLLEELARYRNKK